MHLISAIRRARDVKELAVLGQQLPEFERQDQAAGQGASATARVISSIGDALTQRLIALYQEQAGRAPVEFAWLAVGSLARQELTAHGDQDNALVLEDAYREARHGIYFSALAQFVCDGLAACGIPYCHGEVMASNTRWRQPLTAWQKSFTDWVRSPDRKAMMLVSNFYDMRAVAGAQGLFTALNSHALQEARGNGIFLAHLAANALQHRPPLGFFRRFVILHDGQFSKRLDLKMCGLMPVVELARLLALTEGDATTNTAERLQQAERGGALSHQSAANLLDALEFINDLRFRHQVQQVSNAEAVDSYLDPECLSPTERTHLKAAFAAIRVMQNSVAQRFQTALIG